MLLHNVIMGRRLHMFAYRLLLRRLRIFVCASVDVKVQVDCSGLDVKARSLITWGGGADVSAATPCKSYGICIYLIKDVRHET